MDSPKHNPIIIQQMCISIVNDRKLNLTSIIQNFFDFIFNFYHSLATPNPTKCYLMTETYSGISIDILSPSFQNSIPLHQINKLTLFDVSHEFQIEIRRELQCFLIEYHCNTQTHDVLRSSIIEHLKDQKLTYETIKIDEDQPIPTSSAAQPSLKSPNSKILMVHCGEARRKKHLKLQYQLLTADNGQTYIQYCDLISS